MRITAATCVSGLLMAGMTGLSFWLWTRPAEPASTTVCSMEEAEQFMQGSAFYQVREHVPYAALLSIRVHRHGNHWLATGDDVPPGEAPRSWRMEFAMHSTLALCVEVEDEVIYDSR